MLIYNAGDMLKGPNQDRKAKENQELRDLGFEVWSPQEDKDINDKQNQTQESNNSLAEKIFTHDTHGMEQANIIIFEVDNGNVGTCVEVGQMAQLNRFNGEDKHFYFQSYDIRRTELFEAGDRRSWSINQYLYGAILSLNPNGIQSWNAIIKELKELQHEH